MIDTSRAVARRIRRPDLLVQSYVRWERDRRHSPAPQRVGNAGVNRQRVSVNHDNHIEEVINGNNGHPGFPAITGRLEQPANRQ